jgi:hypothetical protein
MNREPTSASTSNTALHSLLAFVGLMFLLVTGEQCLAAADGREMAAAVAHRRELLTEHAARFQEHCERLARHARRLAESPHEGSDDELLSVLALSSCGASSELIDRFIFATKDSVRGAVLAIVEAVEGDPLSQTQKQDGYSSECDALATHVRFLAQPGTSSGYRLSDFVSSADNMCTRTPIDLAHLSRCFAEKDYRCVLDLAARFRLGLRYDWYLLPL